MLKTGIRVGEMLAVRYDDISEDGKEIHIQRLYRYETKEIVEHTKECEGDRFVPLVDAARSIVAEARQKQRELGFPDDKYIFSVNDSPLPYQPVQYLFEKYCKKMDIVQKSSHKSRKTYKAPWNQVIVTATRKREASLLPLVSWYSIGESNGTRTSKHRMKWRF